MVLKTQTLACMIMELMINTHEANDNLQAEIKLAYKDVKLVQAEINSTRDSFKREIGYLQDNI